MGFKGAGIRRLKTFGGGRIAFRPGRRIPTDLEAVGTHSRGRFLPIVMSGFQRDVYSEHLTLVPIGAHRLADEGSPAIQPQ